MTTYERHWHDDAGVRWLYSEESGILLSYDDPESIGRKAQFIIEQGPGGTMFRELIGDDAVWGLLRAIAERPHPSSTR